MTNQPPPVLPYQSPTPTTPNFGSRAATVSCLAAIAAALLFVVLLFGHLPTGRISLLGVIVLGIIGLISSVAALATMRRYGSNGISRPAIVGLCLNIAVLLWLAMTVMFEITHGKPM